MEEKMQNPFGPSLATDKLKNISTGHILAATTLVDAKHLGLKAMNATMTTNADKIIQPMIETFTTHLKKNSSWPDGFCLVLGVNAQATRVMQTEHTNDDKLCCFNHEEADTKIFADIASYYNNSVVIIQARDTDIIILAMYQFPCLLNVIELWVEKNDLFLPILDFVNDLGKAVGKDVLALTDTLLVSYILSGCDWVSYPFKRGKERAVKAALQHVDKKPALSNFIRNECGPSAHDQ
ncbi:hypothetical protein SK128_010821, partial [Halocaridina rubra]